jgi:hypothetical protein
LHVLRTNGNRRFKSLSRVRRKELNRLEVAAGIIAFGYGTLRFIELMVSLSSLSPHGLIIVQAAAVLSLSSLLFTMAIGWTTSLAGLGLIVDGAHRTKV